MTKYILSNTLQIYLNKRYAVGRRALNLLKFLLYFLSGLLELGLDEAACIVPADTPAGSPEPSSDPPAAADSAVDTCDTASVTSSILPTSESINNLSSKVKTKLTGALGYISGTGPPSVQSSSSVADLSQVSHSSES